MRSKHIAKLVDLGNAEAAAGNHARAIALFSQAIDAGARWAKINLGNSYEAMGRVAEARREFEEAWEFDDDAGFNLAKSLLSSGEVERAAAVLDQLSKAGYRKAAYELAWINYEAGKALEAESLLRGVLAEQDFVGDLAAGVLGHWLVSSGRSDQARPLLKRGRDSYDTARVDFARLLLSEGHVAQGLKELRRGARRSEANSIIVLANYLARHHAVDRAIDLLRPLADSGDAYAAYNVAAYLSDEKSELASHYMRLAASLGDEWARQSLREGTRGADSTP
ncbi:tetratricopeptide repeat protein [Galbitalea sp. SE-J8]|uniref:tetratricopeptide repeat protein n=1 Tax=Galbitalea sp. SE-J8 TaxID=3054952 RepID=UPI00259D295E|nr:tetratricopeptide repeat protein [Galbitalea sp. SE-J8]MDM4764382.1 tetratricopeptide repeat protein [Galbitalea sp. SE-J8]